MTEINFKVKPIDFEMEQADADFVMRQVTRIDLELTVNGSSRSTRLSREEAGALSDYYKGEGNVDVKVSQGEDGYSIELRSKAE